MKKYIHYCWFGGKPLPKLAKKCIKSWKKYLPDYEIIEWNESNVNLNECQFIKEAYENRKWAFVADYVRTTALYEMGGIYFDTDMEITSDISHLQKDDSFLGVEDSGYIAVGVWYEKHPKSNLTKDMIEFYRNLKGFDINNMYSFSIPKVITNLLIKEGFIKGKNKVQILKNGTVIYPRDYFYPLSYDRQDNIFTDNTCMIHYYDSSWAPKGERFANKLIKKFGREKGLKIYTFCSNTKYKLKQTCKLFVFPLVIYRRKRKNDIDFKESCERLDISLKNIKEKEYAAIYRLDWLGTSYATKELFNNVIGIDEIKSNKLLNYYAEQLCAKDLNLIIFSAFDLSWASLIKKIKQIKPNQRIKVLWHGSIAMNVEDYDWEILKTILEFNKSGVIESIGFVKKSMFDFFKVKGYNCEFVMNTLNINVKTEESKEDSNIVRIGIYSSGDRWVKNFYNQLSAASMIENHLIECIPKSNKTVEFANIINANIIGENNVITREELLNKIAQNDINIYTTFVECAPLLPLESLELGVPCITSNNHHYWTGTELEEYLIVNAPDNIIEIKNKIEIALKNKDKILKLYKKWKKDYDKEAKKNIKDFLR